MKDSKEMGKILSNMNEIAAEERDLLRLEREISLRRTNLTQAREALENEKPSAILAIAMHDKMCRHNHTDGCGWYYEIAKGKHDWTRHEHNHWLKAAIRFMCVLEQTPMTPENAADLVSKMT